MKAKTRLPRWTALLILPFTLALASAQEDGKPKPPPPGGPGGPGAPGAGRQGPKFEDMDTDKSGDLDEAEFVAFQTKRIKEAFVRADENKDGKVTKDEMGKAARSFRPGGPGGPRPEGGRPEGRPEGKPEGKPEGDKPEEKKPGEKAA